MGEEMEKRHVSPLTLREVWEKIEQIEKKIDKQWLVAWFFGGFALFVAGMYFTTSYDDPLLGMALYSLAIAILGVVIIVVIFLIWIKSL